MNNYKQKLKEWLKDSGCYFISPLVLSFAEFLDNQEPKECPLGHAPGTGPCRICKCDICVEKDQPKLPEKLLKYNGKGIIDKNINELIETINQLIDYLKNIK